MKIQLPGGGQIDVEPGERIALLILSCPSEVPSELVKAVEDAEVATAEFNAVGLKNT